MFSFFKKNKKEDSESMIKDEGQIAKAKEDITEKGEDSQTEKDRIDESVGEQESEDGNKDTQSAKDRVDESEGAEKADEEKEKSDNAEDKKEYVSREEFNALVAKIDGLIEQMQDAGKRPEREDEEREAKLNRVMGLYNN